MERVAVIGMACRAAGGIDSLEKLWEFLRHKKHGEGDIPAKRWEPWRHRDPRNIAILNEINRKGYFMEDLEGFDAAFFGISPREAELMDPHQRLGLELAWEAIENAGIDAKALRGSDTAVFMGVDSDDYSRMLLEDLPTIEAWTGIDTAAHGVPNRISYHLDLHGPSVAVDAACASSLIAIHHARQAISTGESAIAICGGVNVICAPGLTCMLQKAGALSQEGVCRSFDDAASGYARGEGGAIVVLKRLSAAIADDDNILAILRSSSSAQDGRTNGIMAPNAKAQELVARSALLRAGRIDPRTVDYVEAHATSTALGDPTEINAIARVYGEGRSPQAPCYIGSIKPNIGHLEAAAGAVGFVKTVLSVQRGVLIPQALLTKPNTKVDWASSGLEIVREEKAWPKRNTRRAAVCSYGYGGSVCHAIIEQAPPIKQRKAQRSEPLVMLTLSAIREKRLPAHAASLAQWLSRDGALADLNVVARTLLQRRTAHNHRVSFIASNHKEAVHALKEFAKGRPDQRTIADRIIDDAEQKGAVWVFSGYGAQWQDMGKDLVRLPAFREALGAVDGVFLEEAGFSVLKALEQGEMGSSSRVQVLTYGVQLGLTAILKSRGITPRAIIGHSVGEIAAAVAAGCLSAREGAIIVSRRCKLFEMVPIKGAMVLVHLSFETVTEQLKHERDVVAAVKSSPATSVVSGTVAAVQKYTDSLEGKVGFWRVNTDIGFHSPMIEYLARGLRDGLAGHIHPRPATTLLYSTSAPHPASSPRRDADYWVQNMVGPVKFMDAIEAASNDGFRVFMEISSHPIVSHSIHETLASKDTKRFTAFGVMQKDVPASFSILSAVSRLHTAGVQVDSNLLLGEGAWCPELPTAAWVHKPYWKTASSSLHSIPQQRDVNAHTLVGDAIEIADTDTNVWTTTLDDTSKPYPMNHRVSGREIVPAAVYCTTLKSVSGANQFNNVKFLAPSLITEDTREFQVVASSDQIRMSSRRAMPTKTDIPRVNSVWTKHLETDYKTGPLTRYRQACTIERLKEKVVTKLPQEFAMEYLRKIGVTEIAFPWIVREHFGDDHTMLAKVDIDGGSQGAAEEVHSWAPLLDAATSVGSSILFKTIKPRVVSGIDQLLFLSEGRAPKTAYVFVENSSQRKSMKIDVAVFGDDGVPLIKIRGLRFYDLAMICDENTDVQSLVYRLAWVPPTFSEMPLPVSTAIVISTDSQTSELHASSLRGICERVLSISSYLRLRDVDVADVLRRRDAVVVYIPGSVEHMGDVGEKAHAFVSESAGILSELACVSNTPRLFIVTRDAHSGRSPTCLAQYPLHGFARVAASEYPHLWGGLIDSEEPGLPLLPMRFVRAQSVIRVQDGLPRVARLRPLYVDQRRSDYTKHLMPQPHGTYVITGGFGALGLEILQFLVCKGARRILVVSRHGLPDRKEWPLVSGSVAAAIKVVRKLEDAGATIHSAALDIGSPSACATLSAVLTRYALPPVLGVVHAAGIAGYGFIKDATPGSYADVMKPKVQGALNLHKLFPPGTLDFFVLFSSIGQIIGTPGQSAYATANAFLDGLARNRRAQDCNSIAIQWTAWRSLGLASDTALVDLELHSKGVMDITIEQGLQAWTQLSQVDTDHAVVARVLPLDDKEPLPCELVTDVVQRTAVTEVSNPSAPVTTGRGKESRGDEKDELFFFERTRDCFAEVVKVSVDDFSRDTDLADLGMDSIMTTALRHQLQKSTGLALPPALSWEFPTVGNITRYLCNEWQKGCSG